MWFVDDWRLYADSSTGVMRRACIGLRCIGFLLCAPAFAFQSPIHSVAIFITCFYYRYVDQYLQWPQYGGDARCSAIGFTRIGGSGIFAARVRWATPSAHQDRRAQKASDPDARSGHFTYNVAGGDLSFMLLDYLCRRLSWLARAIFGACWTKGISRQHSRLI